MNETKVAYVGSSIGELSLMITFTDLILHFDLGIPNFPAFVLQVPLQDMVGHADIFNATYNALTAQMLEYLVSVGIPKGMAETLRDNIKSAVSKVNTDAPEKPTLMEKVVALEPIDLLEVKFALPPGFTEAVHSRIVTAGQVVKRDPTPKKPVRPEPSLKALITKYRGQQNKKLTGPIFIMVYDVNGRPVGVRQLRGPGWQGIGGKMAAGQAINTCPGCKSVTQNFRTPTGPVEHTSEPCRECKLKAEAPSAPPKARLFHDDFDKPHPNQVQAWALDLRNFLANNGIRCMGPGLGLKQQQTGTFYLVFIGPKSGLFKKVRISDHPKPVYTDPELDRARHSDFSIDPEEGHGPEDAKAWAVTARSFSGGDIPTNFWLVLDIYEGEAERTAEAINELKAGVLKGVKGISASGEILLDFWGVARNAVLRMPGNATVEANHLSRVMYDNPDYLLSNDMDALSRIYAQDRSNSWSGAEVMQRIINVVTHSMKTINGHLAYSMDYMGMPTKLGRLYGKSGKAITGFKDFVRSTKIWAEEAFKDAGWSEHRNAQISEADWAQACRDAFHEIHRTYGSENEWRVKSGELVIPPGSTLVVGLDAYKLEAVAKWEASDELARQQSTFFGNSRTALQTKAFIAAIEDLKASVNFKVVLLDYTQFGKNRGDLSAKKWKQRRDNHETGYKGAALFTRNPGVPA